MSDLPSMVMARAKALGQLDQEIQEAMAWLRLVLETTPDLLRAFNTYMETATEITGVEIAEGQMAMLKRFGHIGLGLTMLRLTGEVTI